MRFIDEKVFAILYLFDKSAFLLKKQTRRILSQALAFNLFWLSKFMIRRGQFEYIRCDSDPAQLYNIEADSLERQNLAQDPEHSILSAAFAAEVKARWDSDALRENVLNSQKHAAHCMRRWKRDRLPHGVFSQNVKLPRDLSAIIWIGPRLRKRLGSRIDPVIVQNRSMLIALERNDESRRSQFLRVAEDFLDR